MRTFVPVCAAIFMLALATPLLAAEPDRTISTVGEATIYVVPDKVVVNLGVETYDASLDEAKAANEKAASALVKAIEGMNIEKKDIATDTLQVEVRHRIRNEEAPVIIGYFVRRAYAITLRDTKLFETLVDTALKNGANEIQNISFQTTALRKYRDQARQMAIKAAREKAVLLAKELDCTVGKPRSISEGGGYTYFGAYRWNNSMAQNAIQSMPGAPDTGENLPLGQIAVTASISVSFDLQ